MLLSIALILVFGLFSGWLFSKIKFPSLLGMLLTGIVIGPHVLNLIDPSLLNISSEIRKAALIIILLRAGLSLNVSDMKKVGRPAVLLCFVPACFEMAGMVLLAPRALGVTTLDAAIIGAAAAAVSPAVIVPRMIKLIEEQAGTNKSIPQMILTGASVDDVFVLVMFSSFVAVSQGEKISVMSFVNIPLSIVIGASIGILTGCILSFIFKKVKKRSIVKALVILCSAFLLTAAEDSLPSYIPFASLIAVMSVGIAINKRSHKTAEILSGIFNQFWIPAEVFLFVLVGATVDIKYAAEAGLSVVILVLGALVFRAAGVFLCLVKTPLNAKERLFCVLAYIPKATVQAAIGGIPLAMGLSCGNAVLAVAVIAIMITAPIGSFAIDKTYRKLLD